MGYGEQRYDAFVSGVQAMSRTTSRLRPTSGGAAVAAAGGHYAVSYPVDLQQMEQEVLGASD